MPACIYCQKAVNKINEHVIPNKGKARQEDWQYAHTECHGRKEELSSQEVSQGICVLVHLPSTIWRPRFQEEEEEVLLWP